MPTNTLKQPTQRQLLLKRDLAPLEAYSRLHKSPEWEMYLKPQLSQALTNKWLDPTKYPSDPEFIRAYNQAHARAMAYKEVIDLVEGADQRIEEIKRQLEVTNKKYAI